MPYATVVELFQGIPDIETQKVVRLCTERQYRKGATIFSKGDPAHSLYIVKDGRVRIISLSDNGTESIVHILSQGAIFGELLLSEEKRAFTAVARTNALVTIISKASLEELLASIPAISKNFIRLLSNRLAKVEKVIGDFGHTWSYNRLSKVLLRLCEEHGQETPKGTVIRLHLKHEDLANLIGTTRETVTTQMIRFRRMGLVTLQDRFLVVNKHRLGEFVRS